MYVSGKVLHDFYPPLVGKILHEKAYISRHDVAFLVDFK